MFCPKCGNQVDDNATFCGKCGTKIEQGGAQAPSPASAAAPAPTGAPVATGAAAAAIKPKKNMKLYGILAAIVVVIIIALVVIFNLMTGGFTGGQTDASFKDAFEKQEPYLSSVPSSTYVADTPYELKSCDVSDINKQSNDNVTAKIEAVVENEAYKLNMSYTAEYKPYPTQAPNGDTGSYSFNLQSKSLEARTGITQDETHGLYDIEAELSDDGKSCSYTKQDSYEFWFADSSLDEVYTYNLTDSGWVFDDVDSIHKVEYKDIDGEYAAKTGDLLDVGKITISDLDAEKGSFAISYTLPANSTGHERAAATAKLTTTIDPKKSNYSGDTVMKDGYQYYFEAKGTSTGGKGTASMSGYFTIGADGSKTIQIDKTTIDYTYSYASGSTSDSSQSMRGTIYQQ